MAKTSPAMVGEAEGNYFHNEVHDAMPQHCLNCQLPIYSRYLLNVPGIGAFHEHCLLCSSCHGPINGNKCYKERKSLSIHCENCWNLKQCYLMNSKMNFMTQPNGDPNCNGCFRPIYANDWVTNVNDLCYHSDCFVCAVCQQKLLKGAKFFINSNNQILCEYDYKHRNTIPLLQIYRNNAPAVHDGASTITTNSTANSIMQCHQMY